MFSMSAKPRTPHATWVCGGISVPWPMKSGKMPHFQSCGLHIAVTSPPLPRLPGLCDERSRRQPQLEHPTLPIGNNTVTQITSEKHPVGSLMRFRVRTVSSKGPGPWSDALTGLVL